MVFQWHNPFWLNMVYLVIAAFVGFWWWQEKLYKKFQKAFGTRADYLASSLSPGRRVIHLVLQCLALVCFCLALARPQMGTRQTEVKQSGIEMILAVDVSNSMLSEDDKPSRLALAQKKADFIVERMAGSRMGLIAFAGSAHLISPMTTDPSALMLYVDSLSPDSVSTQGTSFKAVIETALDAFDRGGVEGVNGVKPTRALVILSDGEDNEPGTDAALKKAASEGVRVFTVGFGTAKGAPIPLRDDRGVLRGYKKNNQNEAVLSVPNERVLAQVAQKGGGSYTHATYTNQDVEGVLKDLDRLEKADFKTKMSTDYDEKFQIPLFFGILFGLLDLVFGDRRRFQAQWQGRFEVSR